MRGLGDEEIEGKHTSRVLNSPSIHPPSLEPPLSDQAMVVIWRPTEEQASFREGDVILVSELAPTKQVGGAVSDVPMCAA